MRNLRRLLAGGFLCLVAAQSWAVDLCTIVSIGNGVGSSGTTTSPSLPPTYNPGDLLLFYAGGASSSTTDPTGYTLISNDSQTNMELWGKVATTSETAPSIVWAGNQNAGFMVAVHNPAGWPSLASVRGDSANGTTGASNANQHYRALTVTQGGGCAFQFAKKLVSTGTATAVAVTSGYVAAGFATQPGTMIVSGQMYNGDATVPDLAANDVTVTGNSTAAQSRSQSLTLLSGDNVPTAYAWTDVTGQPPSSTITSNTITVAGQDNYSPISVSGDAGCTYRVNSGAYTATAGYVNVGDTVTLQVTSSAAASTATTCTSSIGGSTAVTDTFSVTTAANDVTGPVIISDTFTGANATAITAHTPDVDTPATAWTKVGTGTAEIQSNKINLGNNTAALINTGATNYEVEGQWTTATAASDLAGVEFRAIDANNYFACSFQGTTSQIRLYKYVAGVQTYLATVAQTFTDATTYRISAFAVGNSVGCMLDGTMKVSATDTSLNTEAKVGLRSDATPVQVIDSFYVKRAFACNNSSTGAVNDDPKGLFFGETLDSGCSFWAKTLPAHYTNWALYEGGRVYEDYTDADNIGTDTWDWERWNPATNTVESATFTLTAQDTTATAPVWQAAAINLSWPIGVPVSVNLCSAYLTTQGIPQATITKTSGTLVSGVLMTDGCTLAGTPDTSYTAAQSATFTATNATGAPTKSISITITGDDVPDAFVFVDQTAVTPSSTVDSAAITVAGINIPSAISVAGDTGCKYIKNGGAATAAAGTVVLGDTVAAEVAASSTNSTATSCTVTIGGIADTFTVVTSPAIDTTPNNFSFTAQTGVARSSTITSDTITISGINATANGTVSGGTVSVNGGAYTSSPFTVNSDNTVTVRHTSSASFNTATNTSVTIGGITGTFTSTTVSDVPTCEDIPNQIHGVGDTIQIDLSQYCSSQATVSAFADAPAGCTSAGAVLTCTFTTAQHTIARTQLSNSEGTRNAAITFDVRDVDDCNTSRTTPGRGHGPVLTHTRCSPLR